MAAAGVTIKQERKHTDEVYYVDPFQQPAAHLSSQLQVPAVQVCPINVNQGDSILVKLKYKEGTI
jgi:hypothetical protein